MHHTKRRAQKIAPAPFTVDSGESWRIERWPETREYAVFIGTEIIGYRDEMNEARTLREGYTYDALLHIPAHFDVLELAGEVIA